MRVLFVTNFYPPGHLGGYGLYCEETAIGLRSLGHDVLVLTSELDYSHFPENDRWVHRILKFDPTLSSSEIPLLNKRRIRNEVSEWTPDVAVVWNSFGLGHDATFSALSSIPTTAYLMLHDLARFGPNNLKKMTLLAASQIIRFHFIAMGFRGNLLHLVYPGIEVLPKRPAPPNDPTVKLLFCGRLVGYKGLHVALGAMSSLPGNFRLTVLGKPDADSLDYAEEIEKMIIKKDLGDRVSLKGRLPRETMRSQYSEHDIVLFPSLWEEPLGLVVLEAMSSGIPVISSRLGAPVELITHGRTGLLFEPGNPEDLANKIRILENPGIRSEMGRAALISTQQRFSMERFLNQLESELEDLAQRRAGC